MPEPKYLGDSVYAVFSGYDIELYTSNGISKANSIFLDETVLRNFEAFVADLKAQTRPPVEERGTSCTCPGPTMTDTSCPVHGDDDG